jgi:hypothetical protein
MLESRKKYIAVSFLMAMTIITNLFAQQPIIVAKINIHNLGIHYAETDRAQLYSVLDSNEIILAVDKTLLFIKNNKLEKKVFSPVHIFAFDISKHGNGVIVSRSGLYKIKNFQILNKAIKTVIENPKEGEIIWQVDMLNDSIARFIVNNAKALFYINIDSLETNKYLIKSDLASQYIGEYSSGYIGEYKNKYCFLMFDLKAKSECLVIKSNLNDNNMVEQKVVKFGILGRSADETVPIRYDGINKIFYEMLFIDNDIILYKFNLKDYF